MNNKRGRRIFKFDLPLGINPSLGHYLAKYGEHPPAALRAHSSEGEQLALLQNGSRPCCVFTALLKSVALIECVPYFVFIPHQMVSHGG
jgi:hypothetical protein